MCSLCTITKETSIISSSGGDEAKNRELIEFCKATGLRKKELKCLRGTQLVFKNGIYYIAVTSGAKDGRYRESPISFYIGERRKNDEQKF